MSKYIPERLFSSILFCDSFLKVIVIFVRLPHKTVVCQKFIRQEFAQLQSNAHLALMHLLWSCRKEYWLGRKLEWNKVLFKLTFKRDVVTSLSAYNCFRSFLQVLFVNITVRILLWILAPLVLWILMWIVP